MALKQGEGGDRELIDTLFRVLQKPERRRILFSLVEHDPGEALLVPDDVHVGEKALSHLRIELVHVHIPMLKEAGLVRWERDAELLLRGPNFAEVGDLIHTISEHDPIVMKDRDGPTF